MISPTDSRFRLSALLEAGDFNGSVALARNLQQESALGIDVAEWLFAEARGWHATGLLPQQRDVCRLLLALKPDHFEAVHLMGHAAQAEGDFTQAESFYTRALAIKPDYAFARLALAQLRMLRTGFQEGLNDYEARFDAVTEANGPDWRGLPVQRWRGEKLSGRKLYLWAEQGLGDVAMFAGFLPHVLAQKPERVALGMFPKLLTLFQRSFPVIDVESLDDAIHLALAPSVMTAYPKLEKLAQTTPVPFSLAPLKAAYDYSQRHGLFDYAAPLGDLMVYGLPGYVPAQHSPGYLKADADRVLKVRESLSRRGQGRLVGIAWATTNRREWMRNIPLEEWAPVLASKECHFISLQHQVPVEEVAAFCGRSGYRITVDDHINLTDDAEGLTALVAAMDEIITIDNSTVHLAGALNVPTKLLLPKSHNFRWPEQADGGTLWYPRVKVIRQKINGEWDKVMREAARIA